MPDRPVASISLDLDNLWSYMKTHGESDWETRPSYLDRFIPMALEQLEEVGVQITFFIVGVDADQAKNRASLAAITAAGHEVGNHSYEHEPWLHLYSDQDLATELDRAEAAIESATGQRPVGFRGPGYSWSPALLVELASRNYLFDASTLPTYLGPLARAYYFRTADLSAEERAERGLLFGSWREGLRPVKAYWWSVDGADMLEIPVTTIPVVKTPFHLSYLLWLAQRSEYAMWAYLRTAITLCKVFKVTPSFLLHPLDLIGVESAPELAFFPGMTMPEQTKADLFRRVIRTLAEQFTLVPMGQHATHLHTAQLARRNLHLSGGSVPANHQGATQP